jgi:hypothetical protein
LDLLMMELELNIPIEFDLNRNLNSWINLGKSEHQLN